MKFRKLLLEDFQTHKQLALEFSPSITTIKGPTDVGKSAILRALRWACLNDFPGDAFIRDGASSVLVQITSSEGDVIEREKGKQNVYALGKKEFKAVGSKVPDEIAETLSVSPLNFQGQYDSPFWFAESAPEVSRQLNAVIDLSIIDTSLSNIAAKVRQATERRNVCEERINKLTVELKDLAAQEERVADYKDLKERKREADNEANDYNQLEGLLRDIDSLDVGELGDRAKQAEHLLQLGDAVLSHSLRYEALVQIIDQAEDAAELTWDLQVQAIAAEKQFHEKIKGQNCPICQTPL